MRDMADHIASTRHRPLKGLLASLLAGACLLGVAACQTVGPRQFVVPDDSPQNSRIYSDYLRGRYAELTNDPNDAARFYDQALAKNADNPSLVEHALIANLVSNNLAGAARVARGADSKFLDDYPIAQAALIAQSLSENNVKEALALAGRQANAADKKTSEAGGTNLSAATIKRADLGVTLIELFALAGQANNPAKIAEMQAKIAGPLPSTSYLGFEITPIMAQLIQSYARGYLLLAIGDDAAAIPALDTALTGPITLASAAQSKGEALERLGRWEEAQQFYANALLRLPNHIGLRAGAARALEHGQPAKILGARENGARLFTAISGLFAELGAEETALAQLTLAGGLAPLDESIFYERAGLLGSVRRFAPGYSELARINPGSDYYVSAQLRKVALQRAEQKLDDALVTARALAESHPDYDTHVTVGEILQAQDKFADSEALFTSIVMGLDAPKESNWGVYFLLGAAQERQGKWAAAEANLRKALALSPNRSIVLNYLGYGLVERGEKLEEAFGLIRQAVALDPQSGAIIDSLGWAYYQIGDYQQALEYIEQAALIEPGEWEINDHLGDVYARLGRNIEAQFQWQRALSLDAPAAKKMLIEQKLRKGLSPHKPVIATDGAQKLQPI